MNTARKIQPIEPANEAAATVGKSPKSPQSAYAALASVQILFGVHYVVSKILVDAFPPLVWAGMRGAITTAMMFGACYVFKRPKPKYDAEFLSQVLILSALGVWLNQAFFLTGLQRTTSTNAAVLNSLIPVFTLLFVTLSGKEKPTIGRGLGFIFAFTGIMVLCRVERFSLADDTIVGDLLVLVNCLCFATFLTFGKNFMTKYDHFWGTAWLFLVGSLALNLMAVPQWVDFKWPTMTLELWSCFVYGIVGASFLTYLLNNYALKHIQSSQVALLIYFQPVVAALLAYFWLDEVINTRTLIASGLIFVGIFLSLYRRRKKK